MYFTNYLPPRPQHNSFFKAKKFKNAIVDRGYIGKTKINDTIIVSPKPPGKKQPYSSRTMRRKCRKRAGVEPIIGHVKYDCRMIRNYLKGTVGDSVNAFLAGAGFNFKGLLRKIKEEILWPIFSMLYSQRKLFPNNVIYCYF